MFGALRFGIGRDDHHHPASIQVSLAWFALSEKGFRRMRFEARPNPVPGNRAGPPAHQATANLIG
ncbi:hypothetical protein [Nocardia mangyaensis]|uniref:hypothetical protein n=1 Tax=Nocardia mangyaensis TaxID=2213200 RepID=UPI00267617DF|nr:hypothetical protein [Nocardia mangyaensis]MDO3648274.1 hypothetical protein [Nocardia mangyaensis]